MGEYVKRVLGVVLTLHSDTVSERLDMPRVAGSVDEVITASSEYSYMYANLNIGLSSTP